MSSSTPLDANQVLKHVYNPTDDSLDVSVVSGTISLTIDESTASIQVYGNDGTTNRAIKTDATGKLQTNAAVTFTKNGSAQAVIEDTVTPANNAPLPVKLTGITGDINITAGDLNVQTSHSGASYDSMRIGDGTDLLAIAADGSIGVTDNGGSLTVDGTVAVSSSALPTGASTSALQTSGNSSLSSIDSKIVAVNTGAVVVSSSALPTGASTSALQTSGNASLSSIDSKVPANLTVTATRLLTDGSGVTQPVSDGGGSLTVDGSVSVSNFPATQPVSGTVTVTQATGTNLHSVVDSGTITTITNVVHVDDNAGSLTVDANNLDIRDLVFATDKVDVSGSTLSITSSTPSTGRSAVTHVRNSYTGTPVTTAAYVQLIASIGSDANELEIFDSSGETLVLAFGAAASEVDQVYVLPGGNGRIPLRVPASTRISIKAVSANATSGEISANFYS